MPVAPFSGSYYPGEVEFLLKQVTLPDTPVHTKEVLIQSGKRHYSQMLTHETPPAPAYVELFYQAMAQNKTRLAEHLLLLAEQIVVTRPLGITLVSLARAGTPIGVLLKHILERYFQKSATHYSISIFRDVGLDQNALRYILRQHAPQTLVFVDGWIGKGVIAQQLAESLTEFAAKDGISIAPELYVLTDLSGNAHVSASAEDYLIPSSILNATVSGLVSRSVFDIEQMGKDDFHGCVYYQNFATQDLSRYFIDTMLSSVATVWQNRKNTGHSPKLDRHKLQSTAQAFIDKLTHRYAIAKVNSIKPGIGESTRVLLRREARLLLLREPEAENVQHLRWLAANKAIAIEVIADMPYSATAIIKEFSL